MPMLVMSLIVQLEIKIRVVFAEIGNRIRMYGSRKPVNIHRFCHYLLKERKIAARTKQSMRV